METIWAALGIDPTKDVSAIKRAYAERAKTCHPEEDSEDEGWSLTDSPALIDEGPNPFADHPAAKAFLALYTGKQRKDSQAWMDYFTSGDFLDAGWERRFAGLLLEEAVRLEEAYPVPREFLTWLCAAYRFAVGRAV